MALHKYCLFTIYWNLKRLFTDSSCLPAPTFVMLPMGWPENQPLCSLICSLVMFICKQHIPKGGDEQTRQELKGHENSTRVGKEGISWKAMRKK